MGATAGEFSGSFCGKGVEQKAGNGVKSSFPSMWLVEMKKYVWPLGNRNPGAGGFVKEINEEENLSLRFGGIAEDIERGFLLRRGGMMVDLSFVSIVEEYIRKN